MPTNEALIRRLREEIERLTRQIQQDPGSIQAARPYLTRIAELEEENERLRAALVVAETNLERLEASLSGDWIGRAMFPISEWRAAVVKALKGEEE